MLKKFFRSSIYLIALTVASTVGAILIKETLAAYIGPTANPPSSNVNSLLSTGTDASLLSLTLTGSTLTLNQTANARFYANANKGFQVRLDLNGDDANAEFSVNNGANAEVFKVDESGLVTVINRITGLLTPTNSSDAVTKSYVDAAVGAAGTGDATAANQTSIMGTGFNTANDSLINISGRVGKPSDSPSLTSSLFSSLGYIWNNKNDFGQWAGAQAGTYFKVGGVPYFCQKHVVDSAGKVVITSINESNVCEPGKLCSGGQCISGGSGVLTWSGSTKTSFDCANDGGSVYNTSSGTICEFSGSSCPSSWTQAGSWQRYSSSSFGGDSCGNWTGSAPTSFSNQQATYYFKGSSCSWWDPNCNSSVWSTAVNFWDGSIQYTQCNALSSSNPSTNRVEIGCY
ncbi:MAG: hypothetical protein WCV41_00480 [Patescibacteria group bacterium]